MNEKEKRLLMLEYARLAVEARKTEVQLPTPEMQKISNELELDGPVILAEAAQIMIQSKS